MAQWLDLDALLAAGADEARRAVADAADTRLAPDLARLQTADGQADPAKVQRLQKIVAILTRAVALNDQGDHAGAARQAIKALDLDPDCAIANHAVAMALDGLGHLSKALSFYERAWRLDPNDPCLYHNLGMVAWKLDMLEAALKFYRIAHAARPSDLDTLVNLAGVLRDTGRFSEAVELVRLAIYASPENWALWNMLGTIVMEQGAPEEAAVFYEEAIRLKPDFARAWHNLAFTKSLAGDSEGSLAASAQALKNPANRADEVQMAYGHALSLLAAGRLAEGWRLYDLRNDSSHAQCTVFLVNRPMWDGESPLSGRSLVLIGEQGLGDEVLFMNTLPDLVAELGPEGRLAIACERRLVALVARSYPAARVGPHGSLSREGRDFRGVKWISDWDSVDYWAPIGAGLKRYRPSLDAFPARRGFLTPDPDKVAGFRAQLGALPPGPKIGICWKSKLMTARRQKFFSPFAHWASVLKTPGAVFVSMQYGDTAEEIAEAQAELGVTIHALEGLDLMEDLDATAAAGAALDLVIGPMNTSTNLAGAVGGTIWIVAHKTHWPLHLGQTVPWYPGSRAFSPPRFGDWDLVMADIARAVAEFVAERGPAHRSGALHAAGIAAPGRVAQGDQGGRGI